MANYTVYYDAYRVDAEYDKEKEIAYKLTDGRIVKLDKPVTGAWCVTAKSFKTGLTVTTWYITNDEMFRALYNYDWNVDLDIDA